MTGAEVGLWRMLRRWRREAGPASSATVTHGEPAEDRIGLSTDGSSSGADAAGLSAEHIAQNLETAAGVTTSIRGACNLLHQQMDRQVELTRTIQSLCGSVEVGADEVQTTVGVLRHDSAKISTIARDIGAVADTTKMLAFNARIEAARAGESGQSFAVVAEEVRALAHQVADSANEIRSLASSIEANTAAATDSMATMASSIGGRAHVAALDGSDDATGIVDAVDELVGGLSTTAARVDGINDQASRLAERVDHFYQIGGRSVLSGDLAQKVEIQQHTAAQIEAAFADAIEAGEITEEDLFDDAYQHIPDTDPPLYRTRFDAFTDRLLPQYQDPLLEHFALAFCYDRNGYIPTNNKPRSSFDDKSLELTNARGKRLIDTPLVLADCTQTEPFKVSTHIIDTLVVQVVSVPIRVRGRLWGQLRTAIRLL
ncbi:MAG: methyl-accepting chemotaxis protein [Actinomycetota bacterium]